MTARSIVIETWNLGREPAAIARALARQLGLIGAQLGDDDEVIVTHAELDAANRAALAHSLGRPIRWQILSPAAGYYEHKNAGFDAATGAIVAFLDGDCAPDAGWLAALTAPIARGDATVVAGFTSYAGALAPIANQLDFPYFGGRGPGTVRNFFANNVAFAREVFGARRYPAITPMFHGQCQVLALRLVEDRVMIRLAPAARVTHAWPDGPRAWLATRLLRGADTVSLLPYVAATYAPRARPLIARLGPVPALSVLGLRAVRGTVTALRRGPRLRNLALVAACTLVDALGAATAPIVYQRLA